MVRSSRLMLAATVVAWSARLAGAAEPGARVDKPQVLEPSPLLRIASISEPLVNNERMLSVKLERLDGAPGATYYVPYPDAASNERPGSAPPAVASQLKDAGIGAIVRARLAPGAWGLTLLGIERVPHLPGEDTPNGYVFLRTSTIEHEGQDHVLVHVTKLGRPSTFVLPFGASAGELAPATLARAQPPAVLEIHAADEPVAGHAVVRYLDEYRPTLTGRFLGLENDACGRPKVRIEAEGQAVELAVPAADAAPMLSQKVLTSLESGWKVRFSTTGGTSPGLRSIEPDCRSACPLRGMATTS